MPADMVSLLEVLESDAKSGAPRRGDDERYAGVLAMMAAPEAVELITPEWEAPIGVRAATTTRLGGVSAAPWDSPESWRMHVARAQPRFSRTAREIQCKRGAAFEPVWLEQVARQLGNHPGCRQHPAHGNSRAADGFAPPTRRCRGHAAGRCRLRDSGRADCLPVLFAARERLRRRRRACRMAWARERRARRNRRRDGRARRSDRRGARPRDRARRTSRWATMWSLPSSPLRTAISARETEAAFVRKPDGKWLCDLFALARLAPRRCRRYAGERRRLMHRLRCQALLLPIDAMARPAAWRRWSGSPVSRNSLRCAVENPQHRGCWG